MQCFGFTLVVEESGDGEWRVGREEFSGTVTCIRADGRGRELLVEVRMDRDRGRGQVHLSSAIGVDDRLEEVLHDYPVLTRSRVGPGNIAHELAFPIVGAKVRPWSSRVKDISEIDAWNPEFADEMDRLGISILPYEEACGSTDSPHSGALCAVFDDDPLLAAAVLIGEKVVPRIEAE